MKSILLTGASGFLGSNLARYFSQKNFLVYCPIRNEKNFFIKNKKIKIINLPKNIKGFSNIFNKYKIDLVIHCAGYYVRNHDKNDIEKFIDVDVRYTNYLLEAMSEYKCKNFISLGSYFQYSHKSSKAPKNLYAAYKECVNNISHYYYLNKKINFIQIIIFDTYGKFDNRNKIIPMLMNHNHKKTIKLNNKKDQICPLYIDDFLLAVDICSKYIMKKNICYKRFSIPGKKITIETLVKKVEKIRNIKFKIKWNTGKINKINESIEKKILGWSPKTNILTGLNYLFKDE